MNSLKDKVAIVTGGTAGIGYAVSIKLKEEGAVVYACARHEKEFAGQGIWYHDLDVTIQRCNGETRED